MDAIDRLASLTEFMGLEVEEEQRTTPVFSPEPIKTSPVIPDCSLKQEKITGCNKQYPITYAAMPGGKRIALLKAMQTSVCERNCYYCAFRAGRDFHRESFKPDEMAQAFMKLYQAKMVEGIFLSSGIAGGGLRTEDRMLATAEILRHKLGFKGYIHLKIMPGSEAAQVERAMQLANRVSVNLEAPTTERLAKLAPMKIFMNELMEPLRWVDDIRNKQSPEKCWNNRWASSTTQFVVGGAGESDLELLQITDYLHQKLRLARVYYSGFKPIEDTPLEHVQPNNPWREHRLYQASFLLRDYGFGFEDLIFEGGGNLSLEIDPKLAWAQQNLSAQRVEINRAVYEQLIRIPGIGPKRARVILDARLKGKINTLEELAKLGVVTKRAAPFILFNGKAPMSQMRLFV
jgi:predicted DNA-binding helix-hairpin-helix protein